jgi:hypothetical protein
MALNTNTTIRNTAILEAGIDSKIAEAFCEIFAGNPAASYNYDPTRGGEKKYDAVERGLTLSDIERHLAGTYPSSLSIPIRPSDTDGNFVCGFAAGDCDRHADTDQPIDHAEIARKITELGLPLIITRSKSPKSAHIYLFFKESKGFSCSVAQQLIQKYMRVLDISGEVEFYPKQTELQIDPETGKLKPGGGINLPFLGGERIAFGKDGEELSLEGFIDLVRERRAFGKILASRDLADNPESFEPKEKGDRPLTVETIRNFHAKNLEELRVAAVERNNTLNSTSFFAARAFAAGALEGSESTIKNAIVKAATECGLGEREIASTASSGWESGITRPLKIKPSIKNPKDIQNGLEAFTYFQDNFFIVEDFGGKVRVMWEEPEPNPAFKGRMRLGHQTIDEFASRYHHLKIEETYLNDGGEERTRNVHITDYWLYSSNRRQFRTIVFAPGAELDPYIFNMWKGFSVKPVAGNCSLFLAHLHDVICAKDKKLSSWLMKQLAYWVQNSGEPGYVAIVFYGGKGWGKNSLVDYYGEIWGQHFITVSNAEHLVGRFNRHLMNCSVCHANESFYAGNHQQESAMKCLITDPTSSIEAKGVDLIQAPNMVHLFISSNRPWIVPASVDERRFAVFNLSDEHAKDFAYFAALHHEKENGGKEALLHYLLNMDLKGFNPRNAPTTDGLHQQMGQSLESAEAFWHECLMMGVLPNMIDRDKASLFEGDRLVKTFDLVDWAKSKHMPGWKDISAQNLGLLLHSNPKGTKPAMDFKIARATNPATQGQERFLFVPTLKECRQLWDSRRFPEKWDDIGSEWESVEHGFKRPNVYAGRRT